MKRIVSVLIAVLCIVSIFAACGSGGSSNFTQKSSELADTDIAYNYSSENQNIPEGKKIIRSAKIGIEAEDARAAYNSLMLFADQHGGYEFSLNIEKEDSYTVVKAQIKIPPENLDHLINYVDQCGKVIYTNVSAEDITDQYIDTEIRLKTAKESLNRYYELLGQAANVDEVLNIQARIDEVTAEIEAAEGKLSVWNKRIAESDVEITIRETADPVKLTKKVSWRTLTFSDMGILIRNGAISLYNSIVLTIQWIFIMLIILFPLLAVAAVVVLIVFRLKRKKDDKPLMPNKNSVDIDDIDNADNTDN